MDLFNINNYSTHNKKKSYHSADEFHLLQPGDRTKKAVDSSIDVETKDTHGSGKKDFLVCAECKYPITRETDKIEVNEKHQHVFANPHGYFFQIGCFAEAAGCLTTGEETAFFTWFPGYSWQIAVCGQCWTLMGWAFTSNEFHFYGLILEKLIQITNEETK